MDLQGLEPEVLKVNRCNIKAMSAFSWPLVPFTSSNFGVIIIKYVNLACPIRLEPLNDPAMSKDVLDLYKRAGMKIWNPFSKQSSCFPQIENILESAFKLLHRVGKHKIQNATETKIITTTLASSLSYFCWWCCCLHFLHALFKLCQVSLHLIELFPQMLNIFCHPLHKHPLSVQLLA